MRSRSWCNASQLRSRIAAVVILATAATVVSPLVASPAGAAVATINESGIPTHNSGASGITAGPDGNLWFTESNANQIGRITPSRTVTEFGIPTANSVPRGITAGPDGNLWFTESNANQIGRITPSGTVTEYGIPTATSVPAGITAGPDGNLWFTESHAKQIGRITPGGQVTQFPVPPEGGQGPRGITTGPDRNLWFTVGGAIVGRITAAGDATAFAVAPAANGLQDIAPGPDGNLWFSGGDPQTVGRISPVGTDVTTFTLRDRCDCQPLSLTTGPDGNLWFAGKGAAGRADGVGRIAPSSGTITRFATRTPNWAICCPPTAVAGITSGPDGNLWFTETGANKIGQFVLSKHP